MKEKDEKGKPKKRKMGRGNLSIEKMTLKDKPFFICVFRNPLGKPLYTGKFDPIHSLKRIIPEKASKNQLKVRFLSVQPDPKTKRFSNEDCVISFTRRDDLANYET